MKIPTRFIRRRRHGFTLLEMVIVLGIISMILGGAIYAVKGIGEGAKLQRVKGDMQSLDNTLRTYKMAAGSYPTTQQGLKALKEKPTTAPVPKMWTRLQTKDIKDPWGNEYGYLFPGRTNSMEYEIICKGPDGKEGGDDDISSQKLDE